LNHHSAKSTPDNPRELFAFIYEKSAGNISAFRKKVWGFCVEIKSRPFLTG
jgi:hypothetical protein